MARSKRWLILACVCAWWACGNGALTHILVADGARTTVDSGTVIEEVLGDFGFGELVAMDITASEELVNQGVEPGDISSAQLDSFQLSADAPEDADLSFLESVEIWVEAPELEPVLVAYADDFPVGEATVTFDVVEVDLTDYVVSESLTLSTEVRGGRPSETTEVAADFVLDVGVTLQGARSAACGG